LRKELQVLVVSNGYGEDLVGARLIKALDSSISFKVLPIVGMGRAYETLRVDLLNPRQEMPSGGFIRKPGAFFSDICSGLIGLTLGQMGTLRKLRKKVSLSICIGDTYVLWLAGFCAGGKIVFLPTAKSDYMERHFWIERFLMRKYARVVITRDELTAQSLRKSGINAQYLGNVLMDCFEITGVDFGINSSDVVIGLLPGSRKDAYLNIEDMLDIIPGIYLLNPGDKSPPVFMLAMSSTLNLINIRAIAERAYWIFNSPVSDQINKGLTGILTKKINGIDAVIFISDRFGDVINRANLVIGLAGSANEQAAGLGKPLITFPGRGTQARKSFLKKQAKLLGRAVSFVSKRRVPQEVWNILGNPYRIEEMGKEGKARMGGSGAINKIAELILKDFINES